MTPPRHAPRPDTYSVGLAQSTARTQHRAGPRFAAIALTVVILAVAVACSGDDSTPLTATGPSTTGATEPAITAAGTTIDPPGTTEAPTTTSAPPIITTLPPPPTTAAPPPAPAVAGHETILTPDAPPPRPDINVYDHIGPADINPATAGARSLVYVPHEVSGRVDVIDPATMQVINSFSTGAESQHVIPSWDMSRLYVAASRGDLLTPIDPATGVPGAPITVEDPYNLYFTPDGTTAIVVAEGYNRLDFRDPTTFALRDSVQTDCSGINHVDFSADLTFFVATCEFDGGMIKFDLAQHRVVDRITIDMRPSGRSARHAQPQDVRLSSDGTVFFVADLQSNGLYLIDAATFRQVGFIPAGVGTHSIYPSRDGKKMYVINRGTNIVGGPRRGQGSVAVLDPYTRTIEAVWGIPGGGSPDMGNITADGTQLWLGGRYDGEVYVFDLVNGGFQARIPVGVNPHGLTVWPQPGRFSLGHTGNTR